MEAINIKAYTNNEAQIDAIKAFLKALKIKFETTENTVYRQEFVTKINLSEEQYRKGKVTKVAQKDIDKFIASL